MKLRLIIPAIVLCTAAFAQEGRRIEAGASFLEPLQKRDSVLIWDQFHYGFELKDVKEGTPIALPVPDQENSQNQISIINGWQLDSVKVSSRRDSVARYDIRAYITFAPTSAGQYELAPLQMLFGTDTLVFAGQMMDVREPSIDMENFQPADIKPQIRIPYTFREIAPWALCAIAIIGLAAGIFFFIRDRRRKADAILAAEPAHIRALRKLDKWRGDKYWKPENQKAFYSGVTDTIREYMASRFEVGALEMTSAEIFQSLKGRDDITPELFQEMKDLFERADFVKFAKFTASDEENATVLPCAVRFVTETYQAEIARTVDGNDGKAVDGNDEKEE